MQGNVKPEPGHLALGGPCLGALAALLLPVLTAAQPGPQTCGTLQAVAFDYRTDKMVKDVEDFHFTPEVEALLRGKSGTLPQDLNYTLLNVPNHHRALIALMRYGVQLKSPQPPGLRYPIECYFERALRFRPGDNVARLLYAHYLANGQRVPEAMRQLEITTVAAGDNPFTHYNIGLIYVEIKAYDRALVQAHKAAALGFDRTGLRDQLKAAGRWKEPADAPEVSAHASVAPKASVAAATASAAAADSAASAASSSAAASN